MSAREDTYSSDRGPYIQTYRGLRFHLLDPDPREIDIRDIAHSLSMQCRFTGHTGQFYSVAQHCVMVSRIVPEGLELAGLLHDATEAYVGDVSSPLKSLLPDYKAIEEGIWWAIAEKYGSPERPVVLDPDIKHADNVAVVTERRDFMLPSTDEWLGMPPALPQKTVAWSPTGARVAFLDRFKELAG